MTGVELVAAALAAGASAGLTDTVSCAIQDSYASLREAVGRRLATHGEESAQVLEVSEVEPEVWQVQLQELLSASGVDRDEEILGAAGSLLRDLGMAGQHLEVKGMQVGDHNTQTNTFN